MTLGDFIKITEGMLDSTPIKLGFDMVVIGDHPWTLKVDPYRLTIDKDFAIVLEAPAGDKHCSMYSNMAMTQKEIEEMYLAAYNYATPIPTDG